MKIECLASCVPYNSSSERYIQHANINIRKRKPGVKLDYTSRWYRTFFAGEGHHHPIIITSISQNAATLSCVDQALHHELLSFMRILSKVKNRQLGSLDNAQDISD